MPKGIPISPINSRVTRLCEFCGEEFEVAPHSPQKFCSKSCAAKNRSKHQNKKSYVWLICQNPECRYTDNSDHAFLVPSWLESRQFCCRSCRYEDSEFLSKIRIQGRESLTKYNKSEKGRNTSSKTMSEKVIKLNQDPQFVKNRNQAAVKTINRLNQDSEFRFKVDKAAGESLKERWKDPEFASHVSKLAGERMAELNQNPEFCKKRDVASRENILKLFEEGKFNFGQAQRLLFSRLIELDPLLSDSLVIEKIIYLSEDIKLRYLGANKSHYRIDIFYEINDQAKLAVEVDGPLGHSTQEDLFRDQVRDNILLSEFNINTIRVTNSDVFTDIDQVAQMIISEIKSLGV